MISNISIETAEKDELLIRLCKDSLQDDKYSIKVTLFGSLCDWIEYQETYTITGLRVSKHKFLRSFLN